MTLPTTPAADDALPPDVLASAASRLCESLLAQRETAGIWRGRLSSSALGTATAISAFAAAGETADRATMAAGIRWLIADQNKDGGWGDSPQSPSNLSTTFLALAALRLALVSPGPLPDIARAESRARSYIEPRAGNTPQAWQASLQRVYGKDRTFAAPILVNLAIAGLVPWPLVPTLPYRLAALPSGFYRTLRLHVVSYALPALIAVGARIAHEQHQRDRLRLRARSLVRLPPLQPSHGGFLDAIPLTSFVAMSLAGLPDRPGDVLEKCLAFLRSRQREDGSWPIDTDLATWLTTASVEALHAAGQLHRLDGDAMQEWLLHTQYRQRHPYTQAAPGGWAWTDLPGGVPDADDTSGAILALCRLWRQGGKTAQRNHDDQEIDKSGTAALRRIETAVDGAGSTVSGAATAAASQSSAIASGLAWLLSLQNRDGGFPTFCRGWGKLPFDHSAPEVTAHAIRAMVAARQAGITLQTDAALQRAMRYLEEMQGRDGAWQALWFGSQLTADHANRTIGTARVLRALEAMESLDSIRMPRYLQRRGVQYLVQSQHSDGGWGAEKGVAASVEETALAVSALAGWRGERGAEKAILGGVRYLLRALAAGAVEHPSPIGLYFARLWYSEKLYPQIWTLEALGRVAR